MMEGQGHLKIMIKELRLFKSYGELFKDYKDQDHLKIIMKSSEFIMRFFALKKKKRHVKYFIYDII